MPRQAAAAHCVDNGGDPVSVLDLIAAAHSGTADLRHSLPWRAMDSESNDNRRPRRRRGVAWRGAKSEHACFSPSVWRELALALLRPANDSLTHHIKLMVCRRSLHSVVSATYAGVHAVLTELRPAALDRDRIEMNGESSLSNGDRAPRFRGFLFLPVGFPSLDSSENFDVAEKSRIRTRVWVSWLRLLDLVFVRLPRRRPLRLPVLRRSTHTPLAARRELALTSAPLAIPTRSAGALPSRIFLHVTCSTLRPSPVRLQWN